MSEESKPSVLIVDDVPDNIKIVAGVLKDEGYNLAFATRGSSALEMVRKHTFDVILLDIMMPEMDGFEVCRQLKADPETASVVVIFNTAKTDIESIIRGFEVGGSDYVTKPFNAAELVARVKTHVDLKRHQRELQFVNAAKDRFIHILSQELKGPFRGLGDVLKTLDDSFDQLNKDALRDYVSLARKESEQILGLLENLLWWANLHDGSFKPRPETCELSRITEPVIKGVLEQFNDKNLSIEKKLDAKQQIHADARMIKAAFENVLRNSAMFSHPGSHILVESHLDDGMVGIRVRDKGIGIAPDDQQNLFKLDNYASKEGTNGEKGAGMGLVLSKQIMERNGGTLEVESTLGSGTTVTLQIPKG